MRNGRDSRFEQPLPGALNDARQQRHHQAQRHQSAGVTAIGARNFLIAYNINLNTNNKKIATDIALDIRESGRARRDESGKIISYDIEVQCHSVMTNVKSILEDSGSSWDNLVDVTTFLTDMKRDFKTYNKVYAEFFGEVQPCRTTVEVNALPSPIAIELKCIATID